MPHDPFFISQLIILASLSHSVFERRTTSGCGLFAFLGGGFVQMFEQIVSLQLMPSAILMWLCQRRLRGKSSISGCRPSLKNAIALSSLLLLSAAVVAVVLA